MIISRYSRYSFPGSVRVEDAFAQVLRQNRLTLARVSGVLVVTRGEEIKVPEPPINPAPVRPELVLPPTPVEPPPQAPAP